MDRWPWRWLGGMVVIAALALILFVPDPTPQDLSLLSNRQLLELVGSPRAVVRDAASGQLLSRAKSIVPTLGAAVMEADDVRRDAIISLLQELFLSNDPTVCEAAESTLEALSRHHNPELAEAAEGVLVANSNLRHARALSQLLQHGALLRELEHPVDQATMPQGPGSESSWTAQAHIVVFDARWQGGDEGLKFLLRVYPFDPLALHLTREAPVSAEGLQQLRTRRPRISVRRENESCLGVLVDDSRQTSGNGVQFTQVVPNSPAAQAGLRRGDILSFFNGRKIRSFPDLQDCATNCRPGDRVELQIVRQGVVYRVKLPLGSDFRTGVCGCVDQQPTE